jgi:hypothetical protein
MDKYLWLTVIALQRLCIFLLPLLPTAILPDRPTVFADSGRGLPDTAPHQPNVGQLDRRTPVFSPSCLNSCIFDS